MLEKDPNSALVMSNGNGPSPFEQVASANMKELLSLSLEKSDGSLTKDLLQRMSELPGLSQTCRDLINQTFQWVIIVLQRYDLR